MQKQINLSKAKKNRILIGWDDTQTRTRVVPGFVASSSSPRKGRTPVYYDGDGHLMTIAPTGAGKGTGAIIPTLLTYPGPVVVLDPKGENYAVTARRRREMGQHVIVLDPFAITGANSDTLNPLELVDKNDPEAIDVAALLAELIVKPALSNADPFWDDRARQLVTALCLHVAISRPPVLRNLSEVRYLLNQGKEDLKFTIKEMQKSPNADVNQAASIINNPADKTVSSILSTAQNQVDFVRGTQVPAAMSMTSFDLDGLRRGDAMTIYLILPPERLDTHSQLLRLWIGIFINTILKRRHKCTQNTLFIIDEAAQLGRLNELQRALTLMRGYGLLTWTFWQDLSQLKSTYPNNWESLFNNCQVHTTFGMTNLNMANKVSDLYGTIDGEAVLDLNRGDQFVQLPGQRVKLMRRPNYMTDAMFEGSFDKNPFFQPMDEKKSRHNTSHQKRGHPPAASGAEALDYQVSQWLKEEKEEIKEVALGNKYGTSKERSVLSEANS